ncbi:glutathione S-transferase [Umbelopsis sp. PMI_123]|nr:glutathione S-transferase [Umbelopsis sp. PMI_123]
MVQPKLTFYTAIVCPYAQRTAIALKEVGAEYEKVEIDLQNKPSWYKDVNPETKVPALTVDDHNIAESLVLVELVHDLFPEKKLLPDNALKRAQIRFFVEYWSSKIGPQQWKIIGNDDNKEARLAAYNEINTGLTRVNELLVEQAEEGPYFLGNEFSIADINVAPFAYRLRLLLNSYFKEESDEYVNWTKYPRVSQFLAGITERESFKATAASEEYLRNAFLKAKERLAAAAKK